MAGRAWTSQDDAILRECLAVGGDWPARVGERMDCSRAAVFVRARRLLERGELDRALYRSRTPVRRGNLKWSAWQEVELVRLAGTPLTYAQIGAKLGFSAHACAAHMRWMGKRRGCQPPRGERAWSAYEVAYCTRASRDGLTPTEIARSLGRSVYAVTAFRQVHGLGGDYRRWNAADDVRLLHHRAVGLPMERSAVLLGRSREAIRARFRTLGKAA